jgi:hypothetical protein
VLGQPDNGLPMLITFPDTKKHCRHYSSLTLRFGPLVHRGLRTWHTERGQYSGLKPYRQVMPRSQAVENSSSTTILVCA